MSDNFLLSQDCYQQILATIERIENRIYNQAEINQLWSEVKTIFIEEMGSLPNLPTSNSKKQNRSFRKSQPIWSDDLASLWRNTCQAEKAYTSFKVQSRADYATKNNLRIKFKNEQQKFDKNFRYFKRQDKKQQFTDLGNSALNKNKTDMWSTLKKLNNPPSSRAALFVQMSQYQETSRKYWKSGIVIFLNYFQV